jgi:hypothetical protein
MPAIVTHILTLRPLFARREACFDFDLNIAEAYYGTLKATRSQVIDFAVQFRFKGAGAPLSSQLRLYLTGFLESRNRPESQKITQKVAGKKYDDSQFTTPALTKIMVDFPLPSAHASGTRYLNRHSWVRRRVPLCFAVPSGKPA